MVTQKKLLEHMNWKATFAFFQGSESISNRLWRKSLRLRNLPRDTPIFNNLLANQIYDYDITLFEENHRQAWLYMRASYGPRHVLTLRATMIAVRSVWAHQNVVEIYETFSKNLHLLKNTEFLQIQLEIESFLEIISPFFSGTSIIRKLL